MVVVLRERTSGREPSARFAIDMGETATTYALYDDDSDRAPGPGRPISITQLYTEIEKIIGTTNAAVGTGAVGSPGGAGSVQRVLPRAHVVYKSLFADDVTARVAQGEGYGEGVASFIGLAAEPITPRYAAYNAYELDVRYSSRPYAIVGNDRMTVESIDFQGKFGGNFRLYAYPEWKRFTFYTTKASDTQLTATQASAMSYRAPGAPLAVDGTPFNGIPSMMVPDSVINLTWYAVPRRYLDSSNSFLLKYRGFINYRDFYKWKKGTLLFLGVDTVRTYVPPRFVLMAQDDPTLQGSFASEALVDLSLTFIHTTRTTDFPPDPAELVYGSWLAEGHNLLGHVLTRRFYYANNGFGAVAADRPPSYFAVPFEILFQDPDADNVLTL